MSAATLNCTMSGVLSARHAGQGQHHHELCPTGFSRAAALPRGTAVRQNTLGSLQSTDVSLLLAHCAMPMTGNQSRFVRHGIDRMGINKQIAFYSPRASWSSAQSGSYLIKRCPKWHNHPPACCRAVDNNWHEDTAEHRWEVHRHAGPPADVPGGPAGQGYLRGKLAAGLITRGSPSCKRSTSAFATFPAGSSQAPSILRGPLSRIAVWALLCCQHLLRGPFRRLVSTCCQHLLADHGVSQPCLTCKCMPTVGSNPSTFSTGMPVLDALGLTVPAPAAVQIDA